MEDLESLCRDKIREQMTLLGCAHYYAKIELRFDLVGLRAGEAIWYNGEGEDDKIIRLNRATLYKHGQDYINRTPGHEVCHVVQSITHPGIKQRHGRVWQNYMRRLGIDPHRTHRYEVTPSRIFKKYAFKCACREFEMTRVRIRKIVKAACGGKHIAYKCTKCGTNFEPLEAAKSRMILETNKIRRVGLEIKVSE